LTGRFDCNEKSWKRESGCARFGTRWSFGNWSWKELEGRHLGFCLIIGLEPELGSWCLNKPVPNEPPFVLNWGLFGKGSHQVRDCALWVMPCMKGNLNWIFYLWNYLQDNGRSVTNNSLITQICKNVGHCNFDFRCLQKAGKLLI
jgi:hypothetical protein